MAIVENPYFGLFKGKEVRLSRIKEANPQMEITINNLIRGGSIVGQGTLDGDVVLWMPKKKREFLGSF